MTKSWKRGARLAIDAGLKYGPQVYRAGKMAYEAAQSPAFKRLRQTIEGSGRPSKIRKVKPAKGSYRGRTSYSGGTYRGRFKRGRRSGLRNIARKQGIEFTQETRGTVSNADVVGVGHGPGASSLMIAVCGAIWRKVYENAGFDLSDWNAVPTITADNFNLEYAWRDSLNTAAPATRTVTFVVGDTHEDVAIKLRDDILNASVIGNDMFTLEYVRIIPVAATPVQSLIMGHLNCRNMEVYLSYTSVLIVQNRTPGAGAADDQITDITNNPLTGRSYDFKFNALIARGSVAGNQGSVLDPRFGAATMTTASVEAGVLSKVPGPSDFKFVKATTRQTLNPGALRKSHLYDGMNMKVNTFFSKLKKYIQAGTSATADTTEVPSYIGHGRYFLFEKMCDTGAGTQLATIGYEITSIVNARITRVPHTYTRRVNYG